MTDLAELRRLAEAAPAAPWECDHSPDYIDFHGPSAEAACDFVMALSPATVLRLLDELEEGCGVSDLDTSRWREEGYTSEENCRRDKEAFRDIFGTEDQFRRLVVALERQLAPPVNKEPS